ncbi:hypothetical protein AVEN_67355-1 [Araneus ventricosus]|uniref:Mos1 transposase HTH domain-containing protein n=1 Tax=Araneus ventricosus TaxID=182803 RepID=A0A4Y2GZT6_ARAVE|nr:hypothetical protein AVEN_67355-1 [Araneus ventricosus]
MSEHLPAFHRNGQATLNPLKQQRVFAFPRRKIIEMEIQADENAHHFRRSILLFAFNRSVMATDATHEICAVYEEGAMPQSTVRRWFSYFNRKKGNK